MLRRRRRLLGSGASGGEHAQPQPPGPGVTKDQQIVSAQALVAWPGNFHPVPPGHGGQ